MSLCFFKIEGLMGYNPKPIWAKKNKTPTLALCWFQNKTVGALFFFVVLFCLVFIKYLLQSELNKSYSNVKLIVYWWVLVKQEQLLPVELLRHNEMSFVDFLLKPEMAFCFYKQPLNGGLLKFSSHQKMSLCWSKSWKHPILKILLKIQFLR